MSKVMSRFHQNVRQNVREVITYSSSSPCLFENNFNFFTKTTSFIDFIDINRIVTIQKRDKLKDENQKAT